jgi:hypothetical protein
MIQISRDGSRLRFYFRGCQGKIAWQTSCSSFSIAYELKKLPPAAVCVAVSCCEPIGCVRHVFLEKSGGKLKPGIIGWIGCGVKVVSRCCGSGCDDAQGVGDDSETRGMIAFRAIGDVSRLSMDCRAEVLRIGLSRNIAADIATACFMYRCSSRMAAWLQAFLLGHREGVRGGGRNAK